MGLSEKSSWILTRITPTDTSTLLLPAQAQTQSNGSPPVFPATVVETKSGAALYDGVLAAMLPAHDQFVRAFDGQTEYPFDMGINGRSCAVVGPSYNMHGSQKGEKIDGATAVFRVNAGVHESNQQVEAASDVDAGSQVDIVFYGGPLPDGQHSEPADAAAGPESSTDSDGMPPVVLVEPSGVLLGEALHGAQLPTATVLSRGFLTMAIAMVSHKLRVLGITPAERVRSCVYAPWASPDAVNTELAAAASAPDRGAALAAQAPCLPSTLFLATLAAVVTCEKVRVYGFTATLSPSVLLVLGQEPAASTIQRRAEVMAIEPFLARSRSEPLADQFQEFVSSNDQLHVAKVVEVEEVPHALVNLANERINARTMDSGLGSGSSAFEGVRNKSKEPENPDLAALVVPDNREQGRTAGRSPDPPPRRSGDGDGSAVWRGGDGVEDETPSHYRRRRNLTISRTTRADALGRPLPHYAPRANVRWRWPYDENTRTTPLSPIDYAETSDDGSGDSSSNSRLSTSDRDLGHLFFPKKKPASKPLTQQIGDRAKARHQALIKQLEENPEQALERALREGNGTNDSLWPPSPLPLDQSSASSETSRDNPPIIHTNRIPIPVRPESLALHNVQKPKNYSDYFNYKLKTSKNKYQPRSRLGSGTYGSVYLVEPSPDNVYDSPELAKLAKSNQLVAKVIKSGHKPSLTPREALILNHLRGAPNVVQLVDIVRWTKTRPAFVFPFVNTTYYRRLYPKFSPSDVRMYARQMLVGLREIHRRGIIHMDFKPLNVFIDHAKQEAVIGDFGLSIFYKPNTTHSWRTMTLFWKAPEVFLGSRNFHYGTDMWSFGVTLAGMIFGKFHFFDASKPYRMVGQWIETLGYDNWVQFLDRYDYELDPIWRHKYADPFRRKPRKFWLQFITPYNKAYVTIEAIDLIDRLLRFDPNERLTAEQALKHPFFSDTQATLLSARELKIMSGLADENALVYRNPYGDTIHNIEHFNVNQKQYVAADDEKKNPLVQQGGKQPVGSAGRRAEIAAREKGIQQLKALRDAQAAGVAAVVRSSQSPDEKAEESFNPRDLRRVERNERRLENLDRKNPPETNVEVVREEILNF